MKDITVIEEQTSDLGVTFVLVENPLRPVESKKSQVRPWTGKSLDTYFPAELPGRWLVLSSRDGLLDQNKLRDHVPMPGDNIFLSPMLAGGGGRKKEVVRLVAMIGLAVVSGGIASGAAWTGGIFGTGGTAMTWALGVQTAGTLLINRLLPLQPAEADQTALKPVYGIDGPKNTSTEGIPFPVVYGEHWVGGNIIALFVDNVGSQQQYLNILLNLGEGEIEGIEAIVINEQPLSSYSDVFVQHRLGTDNQEPIQWFGDIVTPVNRNVKVPWNTSAVWNESESARQTRLKTSAPGSFLSHTTTGPANKLRIDLTFPIGLGVQHNDGSYTQGKSPEDGCNLVVGYREAGTSGDFLPLGAWSAPPGEEAVSSGGRYYTGTFDPLSGTYIPMTYSSETSVEYAPETRDTPDTLGLHIRGNSQTALRRSYYTGELDPTKRYEIRIYNSQDDDVETRRHRVVMLTDVNEIQYDDIRYNHTALLGMRVRLNDQLNALPTVLTRVKGVKVPVYDEATKTFVTQWTDNPAWIAYDMLTNTRYGGDVDPDDIKLSYWRQWAKVCEAKNLRFNGVMAEANNLWDAMKPVMRAGRARLVRAGTKYQVAIETQRTPQALFTMGNIRQGSLSTNWSSLEGRANEIHAKYYDIDDFNKQKTLIVADPSANARGDQARKVEIDLIGVVDRVQAIKEATIALNMNKLTQTVELETMLDALTVTQGDVFSVQHDMPNWGFGGFLEAGSTTTVLKLDRPVTMAGGGSWEVLVRQDVVTRHTNTISQILGGTLFFSGSFSPSSLGRLMRVRNAAGVEVAIEDTVYDGTKYGVVVSSTAGLAVGQSVTLLDLDVVEKRSVTYSVGTFTQLTLTTPLSSAPAQYSGWAFGKVGKAVKNFSCVGLHRTSDGFVRVQGLEYRDEAYDDTPIGYATPENGLPPRIVNVDFEGWSQSPASTTGNPNRVRVEARWSCASPIYHMASVYLYKNNLPQFLGDYTDTVVMEAEEGDLLTIAIVPIDRFGRKTDLNLVDKHTYSVSNQFVIDSPRNLSLTEEVALSSTGDYQSNFLFTFDPPENTYHIIGYEVEYKLARRVDWTPVSFGMETSVELRTGEIGIVQFRVRSVYVKDISYSDWAYAQVTSSGTAAAISAIGLAKPSSPKLFITTDPSKTHAAIRVEIDRPNVTGKAAPEKLIIFYSVDDRPNVFPVQTDAGSKLYLSSALGIAGQFQLNVGSGSTKTKIIYSDPQDIVDIDLSGLWWVQVERSPSEKTRYHKVYGISTSEILIPKGEELSFVPQPGDKLNVLEVDFHDSRLNEFTFVYGENSSGQWEVIRHAGVGWDGAYYLIAAERGAEGSAQISMSGKELHYYPAYGPDTTIVSVDLSEFTEVNGVFTYSGTIDLNVPSQINWAAITCCFIRSGTSEDGVKFVRSEIVPLVISGKA